MIKITSRTNPVVKNTVKIKNSPGADRFMVEGFKFIKDIDIDCIIGLFTTVPDKYEDIIYVSGFCFYNSKKR